jgi:hypothetical protein
MNKFIISESEKRRILNMHKISSSKNYIMEQECVNATPNFVFSNYVALPDGVDVAGDPYAMDLPSGNYKLTQVAPNLLIYYVNDSSGCFTGYMIHAGDIRKTNPKFGAGDIPSEINFESGKSVEFDGGKKAKILEISDNKYPKVSVNNGKVIRGN